MRSGAPSFGKLSFGLVALTAVALVAIGPPGARKVAPPPATEPAPGAVSGDGLTLISVSVDLPTDEQGFPAKMNSDVVEANCTSCHSAAMALSQPALTEAQWQATVTKMREAYKAPVAEADVPKIVAYLTGLSGDRSVPPRSRPVHQPGGT